MVVSQTTAGIGWCPIVYTFLTHYRESIPRSFFPMVSGDLEMLQPIWAGTWLKTVISLFIFSTRDGSPLPSARNMHPGQRTRPYQHIDNNIPQFLLVLDKADHMTFSGRRLDTPAETEKDQDHIDAVRRGVRAFYDAYLKGDRAALKWLRKDFVKTLHKADRFEWKPHTNEP